MYDNEICTLLRCLNVERIIEKNENEPFAYVRFFENWLYFGGWSECATREGYGVMFKLEDKCDENGPDDYVEETRLSKKRKITNGFNRNDHSLCLHIPFILEGEWKDDEFTGYGTFIKVNEYSKEGLWNDWYEKEVINNVRIMKKKK